MPALASPRLVGGYDAEGEEDIGIKRYVSRDGTGTHDIAVVGKRIRSATEEARSRLSAREQEVFETYLLGELGDHLSRQVLAARNLVDGMSDTLEQARSSHGIGVRLQRELPRDGDADIRIAVTLLRQPPTHPPATPSTCEVRSTTGTGSSSRSRSPRRHTLTDWNPELAPTMQAIGVGVQEESALELLLADLEPEGA